MNEYVVNCPCCNHKLKIQLDSSGNATAFLLEENPISQSELAEKYGIELGIVEGNDLEG